MNKSYLVIFFILITLSTHPSEQPSSEKEKTVEIVQYKRSRNHIRRRSKIVAPAKEAEELNKKEQPSKPVVASRIPEYKLQ